VTAYVADAKQDAVSPDVLVLVSVDEALADGQHATLETVRNAVRQLVPPVDLDVALRRTHGPVQMLQRSQPRHTPTIMHSTRLIGRNVQRRIGRYSSSLPANVDAVCMSRYSYDD